MGNMNTHANCIPTFLHNSSDNNKVEACSMKVIRLTDGHLFEYNEGGPIFTRDLLKGFRGLDLYHGSSLYKPLPPDMELRSGEVFYLRPSTTSPEANSTRKNKPPRRVSFLEDVTVIRFSEETAVSIPFQEADASQYRGQRLSSVSINPSVLEHLRHHSNGSARVKVVMSKAQLMKLLQLKKNDEGTQVVDHLHC